MFNNNEKDSKPVNDGIANSKQEEQFLRGIQPKHQLCYKAFKTLRIVGILGLVLAAILFALTFIEALNMLTSNSIYRKFVIILGIASVASIALAFIDKALFLRKAPFDDWVYEIAEKRLGTSIIFYDSKNIYIQYDRGGKEVDKREFVSEMSDKSVHYSYFYVKTLIDEGYIMIQCKKRQPIPERASFSPADDKFWNIIPIGLTIHPIRQQIAPLGWYLNDQNKNEELYETIPSTSILICGGTGCYSKNTPIVMYDTLEH